MKLVLLENKEQFEELKKSDLIIVKWKPDSIEARKNDRVIGHYTIAEINRYKEIILRKRDNLYFNYEMYLNNESYAEEAYYLSA